MSDFPFRFYLITDRLHTAGDPLALLPVLAAAGLRALQVREKDLAPAALYDFCRAVQEALGKAQGAAKEEAGVELYLNDRADLALSLDFSGVQLREESLPLGAHAQPLRAALRYGVSTHSVEGVLAAQAAGAHFATFGPVYATASKSAYGEPVGLKALERAAAASPLPLLALGGVTPERTRECLDAGALGVAAISAVWDAPQPADALRSFADALGGL
ncbi:MAG: thiamine phosphate synthase [SAR324 cluster bacterium]|nr:thiamine phosphate synthase [SAR324 cluster bacterium]